MTGASKKAREAKPRMCGTALVAHRQAVARLQVTSPAVENANPEQAFYWDDCVRELRQTLERYDVWGHDHGGEG